MSTRILSTTYQTTTPAPNTRKGFLARIALMLRVRAERRHLGALSSHMLKDIGISPEAARVEAARPAWDAPHRFS